jgi:hypothetical protein
LKRVAVYGIAYIMQQMQYSHGCGSSTARAIACSMASWLPWSAACYWQCARVLQLAAVLASQNHCPACHGVVQHQVLLLLLCFRISLLCRGRTTLTMHINSKASL